MSSEKDSPSLQASLHNGRSEQDWQALASRIQAIEDHQAITDLVYRYTEAIRHGREKTCIELMTDDAVVEVHHADPTNPAEGTRLSRFAGRDEIIDSFRTTAGVNVNIWPMIHNLRIELNGDTASSVCVMMATIWPHGKEYVGEYRDTYRRDNGEWKFSSRTHSMFGDSAGRYASDAHKDYISVKEESGEE